MKPPSIPSVFSDKFHQTYKKDRLCLCPFNLSTLPPFLFVSLILTTFLSLSILYSPTPPITLPANPKPRLDLQNDGGLDDQPQLDECDPYVGQWVPDLREPLYTNMSCRTIPESKNCFMHGRPDRGFLNWRWKPDKCELPRFDPKVFLETVRGKTMAFIGDSVSRNHMESLLCLLSQEETPMDVYKDSEDRFRTWRFAHHNFTLKVLWSKLLVSGNEIEVNGTLSGSFELHLDRPDESWASELPGIDYAIISSGHWFFRKIYVYEGTNMTGCVYCSDPGVASFGPEHALRLAIRSSLSHIEAIRSRKAGLVTLLRTFSPAHFENGTWNTGGRCNRTGPYADGGSILDSNEWRFRNAQVEELEARVAQGGTRLGVLDVTRAMLMRPDGHPGEFWGNKWMKGYNDCVHWCLPGPVDLWNDFLMLHLTK